VPLELLRAVEEQYGAEEGESFEEALAWATTPLFGVSGLLVQGDTAGTWRAYGALVAEALRAGGNLEPVPDGVWWTLLDRPGPGLAVDRDAVLDAARTVLGPRLKGEDMALMIAFAARVGPEERRDLLRRAAEAGGIQGDVELATFFLTFGGIPLAMPYLERAAEAGSSWAATTLGAVLRDQAETWLRGAAEAGDPEAAHRLGDMLVGTGREDEAIRWYRKAAAAGRREVALSLGALLSRWRDPEARVWLSYAAAWGDARATGELGVHLSWEPERDEAEVVSLYERAARAGDANAAHNLGLWMVGQSQIQGHGPVPFEEAMALYRQALDGGVTDVELSIARLLELQGKLAEAQAWYRRAADANPTGLPAAFPPPPPEGDVTPVPDTVTE
jgi:TPR repeat protein